MTTRPAPARRRNAPRLNLALQGGGSHGAFTWGVLDALLEDGRLALDGVCGTSAGAMNAAVLATGLARGAGDADGGRQAARDALSAFWHEVGGATRCFGAPAADALPATGWPLLDAWARWWADGARAVADGARAVAGTVPDAAFNLSRQPAFQWGQAWLRGTSPYQFNPLGLNPLRDIVRRHVDLAALQAGPMKVFVVATAVRTGRPRVFDTAQVTVDALLASACLPTLFQAVTIDGEPHWDGGYSGNPALWPLIYETDVADLLLVRINPLDRPALPDEPMEIADRINEITFNAGLISEMRAIAFVQRLLAEGRVDADRYKSLRLHMVADDAGLGAFDAASKLNTDMRFLQRLFDLGRAAGQRWLAAHADDVGRRASLDVEATFLGR